jgi:hypothetical protein
VAEAQGQFANPVKGECLPLAATTRGLVKTQLTDKSGACHTELKIIRSCTFASCYGCL